MGSKPPPGGTPNKQPDNGASGEIMKATTLAGVAFMSDDTPDEQQRQRRLAYQREYRETHREQILEAGRKYRQEHAAERSEWQRQDHAANPQKYRKRTQAWRAANPERARELSRRRAPRRESMKTIHGRDWLADFDAFWQAQEGRCYLCGGELSDEVTPGGRMRGVVIDHDHRCCPRMRSCPICRRGLACHRCNKAVGLFKDDPALMRRVADALEAASFEVTKRLISAKPRMNCSPSPRLQP